VGWGWVGGRGVGGTGRWRGKRKPPRTIGSRRNTRRKAAHNARRMKARDDGHEVVGRARERDGCCCRSRSAPILVEIATHFERIFYSLEHTCCMVG
jgi:hypothetical protein